MERRSLILALLGLTVAVVLVLVIRDAGSGNGPATTSSTTASTASASAYPGMPRVVDASNIYSEIGPTKVPDAIAGDLARVYVPNGISNTVSVIDPATKKVVATIQGGKEPQHIVVSYDLKTLWLLNNQGNSVVPIDPKTATAGKPITVEDPYNMYFTPDGASAIVVAEAFKRLDFRDPHTMALQAQLRVPGCDGINHADYNATGTYMLVTCEFSGKLAKIDVRNKKVVGDLLDLTANPVAGQPTPHMMSMPDGTMSMSMPQDVRAGPDGKHFYVADMLAGGVFVVDGDSFAVQSFIPTGVGAHGLTPSRDGKDLYVANRGTNLINGAPHGPGSVSVVDVATGKVTDTWIVPGGGSPDMGNLNAAGHGAVAVGSLRQRGLRLRHRARRAPHPHRRRPRSPRAGRLAPGRSVLARPHRQHALSGRRRFATARHCR